MDNKHTIIFILFTTVIFLSSCIYSYTREDFYADKYAEYDLCRMPIIYPYEIVSSDCKNGWVLTCLNKDSCFKSTGFFTGGVDSLNYYKNYIVFNSTNPDYKWGVLDIQKNTVYDLKNYNNFLNFTDSVSIGHDLFSVDSITLKWQELDLIPWKHRL